MSSSIVWHSHAVDHASRAEQKSQRPLVIWFTGLAEVVTKMLLYYLHERAWGRIPFGHSGRRSQAPGMSVPVKGPGRTQAVGGVEGAALRCLSLG